MSQLYRLLQDENGATMIEYGLIVGLVSIVTVAALSALADGMADLFGVVSTELTSVANWANSL